MSWVSPSTQSTGDVIPAAVWNQNVVANPAFLYSPPMIKATFTSSGGYTSGNVLNFNSVSAVGGFANGTPTLGVGAGGLVSPGTAGIYMASCGVHWTSSGSAPTVYRLNIYGNISGTASIFASQIVPNANLQPYYANSASAVIWMASADYVYATLETDATVVTMQATAFSSLALTWIGHV